MQDKINTLREGDLTQLLGQRAKGKGECQRLLVQEALPGLASEEQGEMAKGTDVGDEQNSRKTGDEKEHTGLWVIQKT